MGILIANIAVAGGCGIAIIAIITEHSQKMAKINAMTGGVSNANNSAPLEYIRREIAELRDTTTRYDMSFDSALQRLESRVQHMETRITSVEQSSVSQV